MKYLELDINRIKENEEFKNFYSENSISEIQNSINENGLKSPIVISTDLTIVDGYRRFKACKKLNYKKIKAVIIKDKIDIYDRITRNLSRNKTSIDRVSELKQVFLKYPKKQGIKNSQEKPYIRDEVISKALNDRWKGNTIIKKLEDICTNDIENYTLTSGIIEKNWKVDTCFEFLNKWHKIDVVKNYGFTKCLISGDIDVNDAIKLIISKLELENNYQDTFVIPDKCTSYNIDCIEFSKIEQYSKSVDLILTSPPYYNLRKYKSELNCQLGNEVNKFEYCNKISLIFKEISKTLKETGNVIINIGETYHNGVGLGIPQLLKEQIEKNTELIYKDQLIWSKPNPKPSDEDIKRPINNVEYLLWFVLDPVKSKYNMLTYSNGLKKNDIGKGITNKRGNGKIEKGGVSLIKPYHKIFTHLVEQEVQNIIKGNTQSNKNIYTINKDGHPAIMSDILPITPILMCTNQGDIVYDCFSGSNTVSRIAILLNRKALSTEISKDYYRIGCKVLDNTVIQYDENNLNIIEKLVNPKYKKVA